MITKEEFFKFIDNYNCFISGIEKLSNAFTGGHNCDIFECQWIDAVSIMLDAFIYSHFTDKGADWIFYCLFDPILDKKVTINQEKDIFNEERKVEYHLNNLDELWNFLLTDKKLYFKNV